MPDVRMPDGTIIRNVPAGTSRAKLEGMWKERKLQRASDANPILGPIKSFVANAADQLTFGADDEIGATIDTLNPFSGRPTAYSDGFGKAWNANQRAREQRKQEVTAKNPKSGFVGAVGGAVLPALVSGGASTAAQAPRAAGMFGRAGRLAARSAPAAAQGAAYAFNSGKGGIVDRAKEIPKGVGYALAGDAAGRVIGNTLGRVIGGQQVDDGVRLLADEGVVLTPGQRAGPGSLRNTFEDKFLGSIPFVSDVVNAARNRGANDLRVATANRVLGPIGGNIPRGTPINNQAIGGIQDTVYGAFDNAAGALSLQADNALAQGFDTVNQASPRLVGTEGAAQVQANADYLLDRLSQGPVSGDVLRDTLREIRGTASTAQGPMRDQLWALHDNLMDAVERQNAAGLTDNFTNARQSVSLLKRLEDAASRPGVTNGEFGPTHLKQAVERRGFGTNAANIASGEAPIFDLSNAAAGVMRNTTANSGTVPRALAGGALLGGGAGAAATIDPTIGALTGLSVLGYVPGIDRALQNFALNRPETAIQIAEALRRNAGNLGVAGTGTSLHMLGSTP